MDLLTHMRIFSHVAASGNLDAAARELELTPASVTRHIARLEKHLNCVLLTRTANALRMTSVGETFLHHCVAVIRGADEAINAVVDSNVQPEGHLRVHAGSDFGKRHLIPLIAQYRDSHPQVTFDVTLDHPLPNVAESEFDVVFTQRPSSDTRLIQQNVGAIYNVLCASPEYLSRHGLPTVPEDLVRHQCLSPLDEPANPDDVWAFQGPYGPVNVYVPPAAFHVNSREAIVDALCSGLGIGSVPAFVAAEYLQDQRLVRVLPRYHLDARGLHACCRVSSRADVCLRSWLSFLALKLPRSLATGLQALAEPARPRVIAHHEMA
ncbi:LysR family transcriptional regulator [Pseudomonas sp. dw_358]|uniref:LysR family transcriptional regulator n=1 Tax=Pseudomonas sp. dw_358 TaxID=2720083 RepID=UPI001BD6733B|nr:LysR family transcriptional regulator [Pseudomonas sp. dw_358]